MKEITRIHIAKNSYDIEIGAKKELEKYITKLELYADDPNLLEDIEIRLTEILSDRGIEKDGVITAEDVTAIREQLGDPKEFMGEGDIAVGPETFDDDNKPPHRLYRDTDSPLLGGVLSGIAKYFGVNPLWTRLGFVVLLLLSWGTVIVVYLVLWIVVPPAKTAAEKLELAGKPVTLASIREVSERVDLPNNAAKIFQGILVYGSATLLAVAAVISLVVTVWAESWLLFGGDSVSRLQDFVSWGSWTTWVGYGGFILAGLLLTALFTTLSYALFKKKWTKRLTTTVVVVCISGVITFGAGLSTVLYGNFIDSQAAYNARTTTRVNLGDEFKAIKNLNVSVGAVDSDFGDGSIMYTEYIVSDTPRYEIDTIRGSYTPKFVINGDTVELTMAGKGDKRNRYVQSKLTIYGPALNTVTVKSGSLHYHNKEKQDISVIIPSGQARAVEGYADVVSGSFDATGSFGAVNASTQQAGLITFNNATVETLNAKLNGGYIAAGVVRNLSVVQSDICPANKEGSQSNRLVVQAVVSESMMYNDKQVAAKTMSGQCGETIIGSESDYDIERYN